MKRLRLSLLLMVLSIATMVLDLLWHSPLTMVGFLSVGFGCAGLAILLFVIDVYENFYFRVSPRNGTPEADAESP